MKVCYLGRRSARRNAPPVGTENVIELVWDNWDDFGFQTTFPVLFRYDGEMVDLEGGLRLLVADEHSSHVALDKLIKAGWNGTFPAPGLDYISVPSDITFYQQLKARLGVGATIEVAQALRDASYLTRNLDPAALALIDSKGFRDSLQRERGSVMAFLEGWKILENQAIAVSNFEFGFRDVFGERATVAFNFQSGSPLPHDINVLIGANGAGKSRLLHQLVAAWIEPDMVDEGLGFAEKPNLSQVVVVSYSPFERFPVDLDMEHLSDKGVYRYFGFRGRSGEPVKGKRRPIRLSHEFPRKNAAQSLVSCMADDQRYRALTDWARKVATFERVLRTAFDFDFAAVEIEPGKRPKLYSKGDQVEGPIHVDHGNKRFVPIAPHTMNRVDPQHLATICVLESGVAFFKDEEPIELSSGQRLFAYIVINLLGVIRRNSLVLVDEPELFLHPSLEIQFVEMLKEILASFNSKALLATHSEVVVREVPADCVHVFVRTDDGLVINHPPFQTFGGDIQRISSYVFGDNAVSKPFERWLREKVAEYGSSEALISALGGSLNEELIIQIRAMGNT